VAKKTKIGWCSTTLNCISGCSTVSLSCQLCPARKDTVRLQNNPLTDRYRAGFDKVVFHPKALREPYTYSKPEVVYVCNMADIFHEGITDDQVKAIFKVMNDLPEHVFLTLTKRSKRLEELNDLVTWTPNIAAGVSVETIDYVHRIDDLRKSKAQLKILMLEPLLGPMPNLNLDGIGWVIVGGETGKGCRPFNPEWAVDLRDQCSEANIPFYFNQHGGQRRDRGGDVLNGNRYHQYPSIIAAIR